MDFRSPDGVIEIQSATKKDKPPSKFSFYTVNLNERALAFPWTAGHTVRSHFEQLKRQKLLSKGKTVEELALAVEHIKESIRKMEAIAGPAMYLRQALKVQCKKLQYLKDPKEHYKDIF